jgi:hypothetical protein
VRPNGNWSFVSNNWDTDTLGNPDRKHIHTDDSPQWKYYDNLNALTKAAMTFTLDSGCELRRWRRVSRRRRHPTVAVLPRFDDVSARLVRQRIASPSPLEAAQINNPGRYLVLLPPINGASPKRGTSPRTRAIRTKAWDTQMTFDSPSQFITFRAEYNYRRANVPYFAGEGGVPPGGNNGNPCALIPGRSPDLRNSEMRVTVALLVKLYNPPPCLVSARSPAPSDWCWRLARPAGVKTR